LGCRNELAGQILSHASSFDVVEVIADDFFGQGRRAIEPLRALASQVPISLHGIGLGSAAIAGVPSKLVDSMARLVEWLEPVSWSEHLAFVRGGGTEIGHLAAPVRDQRSVEASIKNINYVSSIVGCKPEVENIAALFMPPGSTLSESQWLSLVARESGAALLLDLHNVHANAYNFGFDEGIFIKQIPLETVRIVHLAGGKFISNESDSLSHQTLSHQTLIDDPLHPVPGAVFCAECRLTTDEIEALQAHSLRRTSSSGRLPRVFEHLKRWIISG